MPIDSSSCPAQRHAQSNSVSAWRKQSNCGSPPGTISQGGRFSSQWRPQLGRSPSIKSEYGTGTEVLAALAGAGGGWGDGGRLSNSCCAISKAGASSKGLCRVQAFGPTRVEEGVSRHASPQEQAGGPRGLEKKLPMELEALLKKKVVKGRHVRLMFQDEARFGRMVRIRRCWAPAPERPVVDNGYEREFTYVYGAVSPMEGQLDWMICRKMNAEMMAESLHQVGLCIVGITFLATVSCRNLFEEIFCQAE